MSIVDVIFTVFVATSTSGRLPSTATADVTLIVVATTKHALGCVPLTQSAVVAQGVVFAFVLIVAGSVTAAVGSDVSFTSYAPVPNVIRASAVTGSPSRSPSDRF